MSDPYQILLSYSFRLLTRKSYSEFEVLERLKKRVQKVSLENGDEAIKKVMVRLKELGYVNDGKILSNFFDFKLGAKPQGKFKFLQSMKQRGIDREQAEQTWAKNNVSEKQLARDLLLRKAGQLSKLPEKKRKEKAARLLASRGFSGDIIWDVIASDAVI